MKKNIVLLLSLTLPFAEMHGILEITDAIISNPDIISMHADPALHASSLYKATKKGAQLSLSLLPQIGVSSLLLAASILIGLRVNRRLIRIEKTANRIEVKVDKIQETLDTEIPKIHTQLQGLSAEQKENLAQLLKTQKIAYGIDDKVSDIQKKQALQTLLLNENTGAILTLDTSIKKLPTEELMKHIVEKAISERKPVSFTEKIAKIREKYA